MRTASTAPTRSTWWRRSSAPASTSPTELVVDKAMELRYVGGVYGGNIKPTPFLCLTLKMLQIQPEKDIIVEFIKNEDFKYVRMLGALYMRLTGTAIDCYKYLEPLYNDYRKIKSQNRNGEFELMHVDEFIDELLHSERVCDIILPRLQKRYVLEEAEQLETRVSALEEDMDDVESSEEEEEEDEKLERAPSPDHRRRGYRDLDKPRRSPALRYRRSRSRSPRRRSRSPKRRSPSPRRERHRSKSPRRHRSRSRERRHRSRSKSPGHHRSHRHRSHSKSPERSKKSHKKSRRGNE
ncbi:pre-mRNA-splicing factor 38A isoform X2 [Terrapene carolina triunguis]|uniref:pre-mRNA-splicing factor 38A isoform X2 n=1 Tax=Terrapene triunguis TaxID=2587831 RepID=UPI000E77A3ED|nr:pre-mRNA-splicing factor 38A isoform X2 [Terrapene carolina triunguis]